MTRAREITTDAKRLSAARKVAVSHMTDLGAVITALRTAGRFKKKLKTPYA